MEKTNYNKEKFKFELLGMLVASHLNITSSFFLLKGSKISNLWGVLVPVWAKCDTHVLNKKFYDWTTDKYLNSNINWHLSLLFIHLEQQPLLAKYETSEKTFQPKQKKWTKNGCVFELKVIFSKMMADFFKSWLLFLKNLVAFLKSWSHWFGFRNLPQKLSLGMHLHTISYGNTCSCWYRSIAGAAAATTTMTTTTTTTTILLLLLLLLLQQRLATEELWVCTRTWTMAPGDCYFLFNTGWKAKIFKHNS